MRWPDGPPTAAVIELVRSLEVTISRRVDGTLHGNYQGITPGHGSEPGEARLYQPGDDVRRIDWNVTARTSQTHVRDQIADRDLEAWLVVDGSAAMRFGTATMEKAQVALAAAACVGFLTVRNKNRVGAALVAGPHLKVMPPRTGRDQVRAILTAVASPPAFGAPRAQRPRRRHRSRRPTQPAPRVRHRDRRLRRRRRGPTRSPASGCATTCWRSPSTTHRERDVPPIGLVDARRSGHRAPSRGARDGRRAAPLRRCGRRAGGSPSAPRCGAAGADVIELATESDWLGAIIQHVRRRRVQAVNAQVIRR